MVVGIKRKSSRNQAPATRSSQNVKLNKKKMLSKDISDLKEAADRSKSHREDVVAKPRGTTSSLNIERLRGLEIDIPEEEKKEAFALEERKSPSMDNKYLNNARQSPGNESDSPDHRLFSKSKSPNLQHDPSGPLRLSQKKNLQKFQEYQESYEQEHQNQSLNRLPHNQSPIYRNQDLKNLVGPLSKTQALPLQQPDTPGKSQGLPVDVPNNFIGLQSQVTNIQNSTLQYQEKLALKDQ